MSVIEAASGHWPQILTSLAGVDPDCLDGQHRPCPSCGGKDRFRFDDRDGTGSWFCNQCGGRQGTGGAGDGISLLMRVKGWSFKQAASAVEAHLGLPSTSPPKSPRTVKRSAPARDPEPQPTPPAELPSEPLALAILDATPPTGSPYAYSPTQQVWRLEQPNGKKFFPVKHRKTPDGPWIKGAGPDPWPLYNRATALQARGWILELEGEKCVDIATTIGLVAITQPGHARKVEWITPRYRELRDAGVEGIVYVSDNDKDGAKRAANAIEAAAQAQLPLIHVPAADVWPGLPPGGSIDDVPDPVAALQELEAAAIAIQLAPPEPTPDATEPSPGAPAAPFKCLGFGADAYFYLHEVTGQIVRLSRSAHTPLNLVSLAGLPFWEALYPGQRGGVNWVLAASDLFVRQFNAGFFDPARIRGRGAWRDHNRFILHLGDRLVVDGSTRHLPADVSPTHLYPLSPPLIGPGDAQPLDDDESLLVLTIAARFHWDVPASSLLLAGWIALAPFCGALSWRPHVWITASAGAGKSAIVDRFVTPLLSDLAMVYAGSGVTEAGIRQELRSDALPVIIDEAEGNERSDRARVQSILALARPSASAQGAAVVKGSAGGESTRFCIRSMFLFSSISSGLSQSSDHRRCVELSLLPPGEMNPDARQQHWEALDRDLEQHITPEFAQRLIARTAAMLPVVSKSIDVFKRAAAKHFDSQALGDQYGTLLAGAWCLQSLQPPTHREALSMITAQDWSSYRESADVPDEVKCRDLIFEHQLRVETSHQTVTRSIAELCCISEGLMPQETVPPSDAAAVLGRHGIRVEDHRVYLRNGSTQIARILADTPWRDAWKTLLLRLPGAQRESPTRFKGIQGAHRALSVPLA